MSTEKTKFKMEVTFGSPFMAKDRLTFFRPTLEECNQGFYDWWHMYGKDQREAEETVIMRDIEEVDYEF